MIVQCKIDLVHWPYEHVRPVGTSDEWYSGVRLTPVEQHLDHWLCVLSDEPSLSLPGAAVRVPKDAFDRLPHEHEKWLIVEPVKKVRRSATIRYDYHVNNGFWSAYITADGLGAAVYMTKPDTDNELIRVYNYKAKGSKLFGTLLDVVERYARYEVQHMETTEAPCIAGLYMTFGEIPKALWWKPVKR